MMSVDNWLLCSLIYSCAACLLNFAMFCYFMHQSNFHNEERPILCWIYILLGLFSGFFGTLHQSNADKIIKNPQQYIEQKGPKIIPYDAERML